MHMVIKHCQAGGRVAVLLAGFLAAVIGLAAAAEDVGDPQAAARQEFANVCDVTAGGADLGRALLRWELFVHTWGKYGDNEIRTLVELAREKQDALVYQQRKKDPTAAPQYHWQSQRYQTILDPRNSGKPEPARRVEMIDTPIGTSPSGFLTKKVQFRFKQGASVVSSELEPPKGRIFAVVVFAGKTSDDEFRFRLRDFTMVSEIGAVESPCYGWYFFGVADTGPADTRPSARKILFRNHDPIAWRVLRFDRREIMNALLFLVPENTNPKSLLLRYDQGLRKVEAPPPQETGIAWSPEPLNPQKLGIIYLTT